MSVTEEGHGRSSYKYYVDTDHLMTLDPTITKALMIIYQQITVINEQRARVSQVHLDSGMLQNVATGMGPSKTFGAGYLNTLKIQRIIETSPMTMQTLQKEVIPSGPPI